MGIRLKLTPAQKLARAKARKKAQKAKGGLDRSPLNKKEQADFDAAKRRGKGHFTPAELKKMKEFEEMRRKRLMRMHKKKKVVKQRSTKGYA